MTASTTANMTLKKLIALIVAVTLGGGTMSGGAMKKFFLGFKWSKTVSFEQSGEVVVNPMTGFAPIAENTKVAEKYSLVYVDVTWRELEPEEGVFAFEEIDRSNHLERWRADGKRVVFRFVLDKPGSEAHMDIPDWLYEKTGGAGYAYDHEYGKGFSPDYTHPDVIEGHAKAIRALGAYYGKDDFFAYIELGSLGHWGEWHVKYDAGVPRLPNEEIRDKYIQPYLTAFPNSQILMRRPFTPCKVYGFGVYNDMTGHAEATEEWLGWINYGGKYSQTGEPNVIQAVPEIWNKAAVGGELTSSISMDWLLRFHLNETLNLIKRSHMTFIGPKIPEGDIYAESAGEILKNLGYRYRIEKVSARETLDGKKLKVKLHWINDGVAPLYWDWDVYLYLLDSENSIVEKSQVDIKLSELTEGKTITTQTLLDIANKQDNSYKLCIGIIDPNTGEPAVQFAMDAERIGNMTVLAEWNDLTN